MSKASREIIRQTIVDALTAWNKCKITDEQLMLLRHVYVTLIDAYDDLGETGLFLNGYRERLRAIEDMIARRNRN